MWGVVTILLILSLWQSYLWLNLVVLIISVNLILGIKEIKRQEDEFIWDSNRGPTLIDRIKLVKFGNDKKFTLLTWVGELDGYYEGNGKKFNRYLVEIT